MRLRCCVLQRAAFESTVTSDSNQVYPISDRPRTRALFLSRRELMTHRFQCGARHLCHPSLRSNKFCGCAHHSSPLALIWPSGGWPVERAWHGRIRDSLLPTPLRTYTKALALSNPRHRSDMQRRGGLNTSVVSYGGSSCPMNALRHAWRRPRPQLLSWHHPSLMTSRDGIEAAAHRL